VGLAGILGSGLSLERSRACRPCRCSKATLLRYCSTGVGVRATGGVERARVMTGWYPVGILDSRADEKADDEPDSWVLDESLNLDRLATRSPGRGATATLADAMDDEMHYCSSSSSRAQSLVEGWGRSRMKRLVSLFCVMCEVWRYFVIFRALDFCKWQAGAAANTTTKTPPDNL